MAIRIPTEPIGSIPRSSELIAAQTEHAADLAAIEERALAETIRRMEETGSPILTDGEQTKPSFVGYPLAGLSNLAADGIVIPFADGHQRRLPRLTSGPFRYARMADRYLTAARRHTSLPLKQAVIAVSALSLLYPPQGIPDYPRQQFLDDLVAEGVEEIRRCLDAGAVTVQIDFTEGRLACKLDPSLTLLRSFVALHNRVLDHFNASERIRIGVHTCPGGDQDSTHSADVDYALLIPELFRIKAGAFFVQMASEPDPARVLRLMGQHLQPGQRLFIGVTDPIRPEIETPGTVCRRILDAVAILGADRVGSTDDCGFSPFGDDRSTARDIAFAKIRARVEGTRMAEARLNAAAAGS